MPPQPRSPRGLFQSPSRASATAAPPTDVTISLPALHPAQRAVVAHARRFTVLACGRRWGKTRLGIDRAVNAALGGRPVGWFSPTYRMLADVWRDLAAILRPIATAIRVQERRIDLFGGGSIDLWSLDRPDVARGRRYGLVIIDEAAMISDLAEAWQAVLRPTLTDLQGHAWFLSTPRGRNAFWSLYQRGLDPADPEFAAFSEPTSANPFIAPSEIAAAQRDLPAAVFAQEFLAEFLDQGFGVFRRLQEALLPPDAALSHSGNLVGGVDWGKLDDFTVFSVLDAATGRQVALDRFSQIDYTAQLDRLIALHRRLQPRAWVAERNAMGEPLIEAAQRAGLPIVPFMTTNATKAAIIDALALAFESGAIHILPDPVQLAELQAFAADRTPSGLLRYGAPAGIHDDTVMALALAWHGAQAPAAAVAGSAAVPLSDTYGPRRPR